MYKTDHSAVFDGTAENFYEFAMAHGIEEAFKVKVYYMQPLTWDNVFCILSFMRYVSITIV